MRMFAPDHPPPHFHAVYGGDEAMITIDPIRLHEGNLPPRALSLVLEWAALHQQELMQNWNALRANRSPAKIPGLK